MASMNLEQVYTANPSTTIGNTDLVYLAKGGTTDSGINGADLIAQLSGGGSVTPQDIQQNTFTYAIDTGLPDAYVVAYTPPNAAYIPGMSISFEAINSNVTTTPTVDVDGLGAVDIRSSDGSTLAVHDITVGNTYYLILDASSSSFRLLNPNSIYAGGGGSVTPQDIQNSSFVYSGVDTGTADNYIIDLNPPITAYEDGMIISFLVANSNMTNAPTVNVNSIGAVNIFNAGISRVSPQDMGTNQTVLMQYSATVSAFLLYNPVSIYTLFGSLYNGSIYTVSDLGTANVYTGSYNNGVGAPLTSTAGMIVNLAVINANTGPSTFQLTEDPSPIQIVQNDGVSDILPGMMPANGAISSLYFNGTVWQLLNPPAGISNGLSISNATNEGCGNATLSSGLATVANTSVTSNSIILLTAQDSSSVGALSVSARTPGTGFNITSSSLIDSGVVGYVIIEPV